MSFLAILLERKRLRFVLLWRNKKTESFTSFLGVLAMMDVVGVYHTLQIAASFFRPPLETLVNNNVMEDQVKQAIAEDSDTHSDSVWTVFDDTKIVNERDGGDTEDHGKPVVSLQGMVMYGVVRSMPNPEKTVHDVFVCEPGNKLPEKEGPDGDQGAKRNCCDIYLVHEFLKKAAST